MDEHSLEPTPTWLVRHTLALVLLDPPTPVIRLLWLALVCKAGMDTGSQNGCLSMDMQAQFISYSKYDTVMIKKCNSCLHVSFPSGFNMENGCLYLETPGNWQSLCETYPPTLSLCPSQFHYIPVQLVPLVSQIT